VDQRDLTYFEIIVDLGHMGRAAEQLGRTQPALSKSVQRLQEAVGAVRSRGPRHHSDRGRQGLA
jgi:DNA-binding transcriptional LysR family regulator